MSGTKFDQVMDALTTRKGAIGGVAALLALGVITTFGSGPAVSTGTAANSQFNTEQTQAIQQIVKDYLLKNPEILVEVGKELEKRQADLQAEEHSRVILERKADIFSSPSDFVFGNPKGNVSVVEFFDYNCGWCKRAVDELVKLTEADPNVRVVFKEFPIFGENSVIAATAAMASKKQGKYWDFHVALMKERQVTKDNVFTIAEKVGLDVAKLKADMADPEFATAIKKNAELAQALGMEGTPAFIVDSRVNVGYLPADGLNQLITEVRKSGCKVC